MDISLDRSTLPAVVLPEGDARALLRGHTGDGLETWLADQRWRAAQDGSWLVEPARDGCTYRVEGMPSQTLRIIERVSDTGSVTSWLIA
jgi:hypothetical protein